ncbi:hypothetical protein ERX46_12665 [Brumimicrobium glaciale]|uniref:Uncharacterized protein n=1 Tax=Brumimicrobium glaciale TaxID=200475 RepID=A0A4Q4KI43_9FLAO|nr:hypothetical protein [Brumimicrobium glaciale]RYM32901.1 hypothetical protein ERX46_12665 [Brumimicrobium glaciale]
MSISIFTYGQKSENKESFFIAQNSVTSNFRLGLNIFQFGVGMWDTKTNGPLPDPSKSLISTTSNLFTGFQIDFQGIFKDKLGFETGFDFVGGTMNESKIRNEFQNNLSNYDISFAKNNSETGYSPFKTGYNFRLLKIGLIGFFPFKKAVIIPYADYLYTIEADFPSVEVNFFDKANNISFKRKYEYEISSSMGFKVGTAIRGYFKFSDKPKKRSSAFFQIKTEFVYLKANGSSYYTDASTSNSIIESNPINFNQNSFILFFGITLGGFEFNW